MTNRHNVGFMTADRWAAAHAISFNKIQHHAIIAMGRSGERRIIMAKPQTYMNDSGRAVGALLRFYKIPVEQLLVIFDDLDLPFGAIRLRADGGAGGHNGMRSIIQHLGGNRFARLRIGIGRPPGRMEPAAFVLQDFNRDEAAELDALLDRADDILVCDDRAAMLAFSASHWVAAQTLTFDTLGWVVRIVATLVLLRSIWRLSGAIWRRTTGTDIAGAPVMSPREQAATWGWVLVLLMLLGPVLLPWYVVWALPLAWVLPKAPRTALIATSALLGATLWSTEAMRYPGAFDVNVFVANWLVVPVIVGMLVWLLRDLRSRIHSGLLFEDEIGLREPAPPALAQEPAGEQRVTEATGQGAR